MEEEKEDLYRYACYRPGDEAESEDVLQEVFLALCDKAHLLAEVENMRNYLFRTLTNQCGMLLRNRQKRYLWWAEIWCTDTTIPTNLPDVKVWFVGILCV